MTNNMTVGKPGLVMLKFALPMAIGNILQQLYNISDTIIIGKYLGERALASVGTATNITFLLVALATGLGTGVSVIISNYFGAEKTGRLKTALFTGLITSVSAGLILTAIFIVGNKWLLMVLNTPDEIFSSVKNYLVIYTYGILFIFIFNICNAFFQALGDSKTPLCILIFSTALNIALDLLFIIKFQSGISGAAYATVISEFTSMTVSLVIMYFQLIRIGKEKNFRYFDCKELFNISNVAVPSILQQSVISLGIMLMQSLINSYGTIVIAAYTSATKIVNIIGSPMANMGNAVSTYAAQNIGAGKKARIHLGIRAALLMNMILSATIITIICLKGEFLLGLFVNKADESYDEVIQIGMEYLIIICFGNPIFGCMHVFSGALRGVRNMFGFTACFFMNITVRILFAYLLSDLIGRKGMWYAVIIGWISGLTVAVISYYSGKRSIKNQE